MKFCTTVDGDDELLLVAAEDKVVTIYAAQGDDSASLPLIATLAGHENR